MIIESEFSDNAEGEEIFKKHLTLKFRYDIISTLTIWQRIKYAGVAELADALASGASDRKVVWVQVPSPAPRQVVEIRLVFLLLIHFKTAVAELHQIFDLVVAEMLGVSADRPSASPRCPSQYWRVGSSPISRTSVKDIRFSSVLYFYS